MERPFKYKTGFGFCSRQLKKGNGVQIIDQFIPVDREYMNPEKPDFVIVAIAMALISAGDIDHLDILNKEKNVLKKIEKALHYNQYVIQNVDVKVFAEFEIEPQMTNNIKNDLAGHLFIKSEQLSVLFFDKRLSDDVIKETITARVSILLATK